MGVSELTLYAVINIIGWIVVGIRLMKFCDASGVSSGWLSFVPLFNFTRWARLAGKNPWLVLLFLIPIVGLILELMWLSTISEKTGTKSPWFWVYLILTLGAWSVAAAINGTVLVIVLLIVMVVLIAAQWIIFDPTKPIAGVAHKS